MNPRPSRRMLLGVALFAGLAACVRPAPVPSYVLFFTALSSQLSEEALAVVKDAAAAARNTGNNPVTVEGYVDNAGSPAADVTLSLQRAQRVADALVQNGVGRDRIRLDPKGSTGDPGVVSRRVEIIVVPH